MRDLPNLLAGENDWPEIYCLISQYKQRKKNPNLYLLKSGKFGNNYG